MNVLLYTAIYGGYDTLKPLARQTVDCDRICVADTAPSNLDEHLGFDFEECGGWQAVLAGPMPIEGPPRLAGRWWKCQPYRAGHYSHSIWIDGSIEITSPTFVADMLALLDDTHDLALFAHPDRTNLVDELKASRPMGKYAGVDRDGMLATICREHNHDPAGGPLYAGGVIVRRHSSRVTRLGDRWWDETVRWSTDTTAAPDQLSLPPLLAAAGITPAIIPGNIWTGGAGGWFRLTHHPVDR